MYTSRIINKSKKGLALNVYTLNRFSNICDRYLDFVFDHTLKGLGNHVMINGDD